MPDVVDTIDELTIDWFTTVLRSGKTIGRDTTVATADCRLFGTGQVARVVKAELGYTGDASGAPASVIVKIPAEDPASRQLGTVSGAYEAEVRFYESIAPRTEVSVPTVYWSGMEPGTGRFTLVLEDLSATATVGDVVTGGTPEQIAAALAELVKLQAPLWNAPSLTGETWLNAPEKVQMRCDAVAVALPGFLDRFRKHLDDEHVALIERVAPLAGRYPEVAWRGPMVPVHSDFRLDNLLFHRDAGALRATVIDWQLIMIGPPLIDACLLMASGLEHEQRRASERGLLEDYHRGLCARGVEDFSFDDCLAGYRSGSVYGLLMMVAFAGLMEQTERGDLMIAEMFRGYADLVSDHDAASLLG